ncbi:MAG: type II toxin-antitoxin system RelE/ParE family toxin [Actinomycetota bacterium]|nr:type II toxin-antitoxin system RelE/ParE family toxin [Actinomycetota bacterium]
MTEAAYELLVAAGAERGLARLPDGVAAAIVEFMLGALVEAPRRVGHELQRELAGAWAARRGRYRVVYEIDDSRLVVKVLRIDHRSDVYRPR